jgi:hypothetical protein
LTAVVLLACITGFCFGLTDKGYKAWNWLAEDFRGLAGPRTVVPYKGTVLALVRDSSDLAGVITTVEPRGYRVTIADDLPAGLREIRRIPGEVRMIVIGSGINREDLAALRRTARPRTQMIVLPRQHPPEWVAVRLLRAIQG